MFEAAFMGFISNHKFEVLSNLKTTNEEYRRLVEARTQHSADLLSLTHESALALQIQDYIDAVNATHDYECDYIYKQGFSDCLRVLRLLGAL